MCKETAMGNDEHAYTPQSFLAKLYWREWSVRLKEFEDGEKISLYKCTHNLMV